MIGGLQLTVISHVFYVLVHPTFPTAALSKQAASQKVERKMKWQHK